MEQLSSSDKVVVVDMVYIMIQSDIRLHKLDKCVVFLNGEWFSQRHFCFDKWWKN